jgi:hypothetical protein
VFNLVASVAATSQPAFDVVLPLDVVLNHLPTAPALLSPVAGAHTGSRPLLQLAPASDDDGDALRYLCEAVDGGGSTAEVQGPDTSLPLGPLAPGAWTWRCRTWDGYGWGPWSDAEAFVVDPAVDNHAPAAPVLLFPEDGAVDVALPVVLEWSQAVDVDGDVLLYQAQVATEPGFVDLLLDEDQIPMGASPTVRHEVAGLEAGASYHARVRAADLFSVSPWVSAAFSTVAPVVDAGVDAGPATDASAVDAPVVDASAADAQQADASAADGGVPDAVAPDATAADHALSDVTAPLDAGVDAALADARPADGARPDTAGADAGADSGTVTVVDSGGSTTGRDVGGQDQGPGAVAAGCDCLSARDPVHASAGLLLIALLGGWRRRRRS